jgi:cell division protein ZapA (FtsZ GTPase activity inhibitor)
VVEDPFYWATEAAKLRIEQTPNLVSRELREQPQRRIFATAIVVITTLMIIASLLASSYFLAQTRQEAATARTIERDVQRLQTTRADLEKLDHELSRKKQVIHLILGERPPPIPAWFLAYLNEATPPELVVTNFHIAREEDYYKVQLGGTLQKGLPPSANAQASDPVDLLKARLAGPPFHVKIAETTDEKPVRPAPAANPASGETTIPGWLSRLTGVVTRRPSVDKPPPQDHFVIEGIMR